MDKAQLNVVLCFTFGYLWFLFMKTHGHDRLQGFNILDVPQTRTVESGECGQDNGVQWSEIEVDTGGHVAFPSDGTLMVPDRPVADLDDAFMLVT